MPTKKKSKKNRETTGASQLTKFSTWPDPSQQKIKLKWSQDLKDDLPLIEKINELNAFAVSPEDFLSLNGDVSVYGWQHVMNFALYEKYNFLVPLLKMNLSDKHFKELMQEEDERTETHGLRDFVYVYCTMLTLILRKQNPSFELAAVLRDFTDILFEGLSSSLLEAFKELDKE